MNHNRNINVRRSLVAIAAAVGFAGANPQFVTPAGAQTASAPVTLEKSQLIDYKGAIAPHLYLRFANTTKITADVVQITVDLGQGKPLQTFSESGTFSTGAHIDRSIALPTQYRQVSVVAPVATVTYAHFTDGTSWSRPLGVMVQKSV